MSEDAELVPRAEAAAITAEEQSSGTPLSHEAVLESITPKRHDSRRIDAPTLVAGEVVEATVELASVQPQGMFILAPFGHWQWKDPVPGKKVP